MATNLLVEGDIVLLESGNPVPCKVSVHNGETILDKNDIFEEKELYDQTELVSLIFSILDPKYQSQIFNSFFKIYFYLFEF